MTTTNADGLLTQAEVDLAARYEAQGLSHDDAVRKVKGERVGPAALLGREDEVPARNVPGGEIANPSPNAPPTAEARREQLLRDQARIAQELADVEREIEETARLTPPPPESESDESLDTNDLDLDDDNEISDDELRQATVEDLAAVAAEYPELRVRILALEREKGSDGRAELFTALGEDVPDELAGGAE